MGAVLTTCPPCQQPVTAAEEAGFVQKSAPFSP